MRPLAVSACLAAALLAAPALQAETMRFTATGLIHHEAGDILGTGASALGQTLSVSIDLPTPLVYETAVEGLDGWALLTGGAAGTPLSAALDLDDPAPLPFPDYATLDLSDDLDTSADPALAAQIHPDMPPGVYDQAWITAANGSAVWGMLIFGPSDWIDAGVVALTDIGPDWYVSIYMDLVPPQSGFVMAAATAFSVAAVPLPLPAALLGAGLLGLAALRRRPSTLP